MVRILVVEKNMDANVRITDHYIADVVYPLNEAGYRVETVQSLTHHRFADFEEYKGSILEQLANKASENDETAKLIRSRLLVENGPYDYFRKTSIETIDDLTCY